MGKEILMVVDSMSNERGVEKEVIFEAVEEAIASIAARNIAENDPNDSEGEACVRVTIDRKSGDYETFRCWRVVEEADFMNEAAEYCIDNLPADYKNLSVGDEIKQQIESPAFGRIAAQQARQVIFQKIREAEKEKVLAKYSNEIGELFIGSVKRVNREGVTLEFLDGAEAILGPSDMIPREKFRINDRVRVYLKGLSDQRRGPQLIVSRTSPEMLKALFRIEVPEISEDVIQILAAARDPGSRAKIAIKTNDGRIDPKGACIGMRGARVQAVSNELGGERIDIILWDDDPAKLVMNAMAPAEVESLVIDEENHSMDIAVSESNLSQAIGRNGQNVRLASQLTGWELNVMGSDELATKYDDEMEDIKKNFQEALDVDEDVAILLAQEGFSTVGEIACASAQELEAIAGFDKEIVEILQNRASDHLLTVEIAVEEEALGDDAAVDGLSQVDGITPDMIDQLLAAGVNTRDDLAEFSVDELQEILEIDNESAARLIMSARAHWFED
jgi:N utilization substance protein A